jgi:hypothetical protein
MTTVHNDGHNDLADSWPVAANRLAAGPPSEGNRT